MSQNDVIITSDVTKLPPDVAVLLNPALPLPDGVAFFEKRYNPSEIFRSGLIASGLALFSLLLLPFGIIELFARHTTVSSHTDYWPLGISLVMALGSWMMFQSLPAAWRMRGLQQQGKCTRHGTFLLPDRLVQVSVNDTTVIPSACFRGLVGNDVKYFFNNVEKSFRLPAELVNSTPSELQKAIENWIELEPAQTSSPTVSVSEAR